MILKKLTFFFILLITLQSCNTVTGTVEGTVIGVAKHIVSTTYKPLEVFLLAGGIYLFMTFIIHNLIKYLEKKYSFQ